MEQIKKLLRDLENEISSEKFIKLYEDIRKKYQPIESYLTPKDLIACLHNQTKPDYILNDKILAALSLEYKTQANPGPIGSYLLILFKPGLLKIFSQFKSWSQQFASISELDIWLEILTLFFEELGQIDLNKGNVKIASRILSKVRHRMRDYFKTLFKERCLEKELKTHPEDIYSIPFQPPDPKEISTLLDKLIQLKVISEIDKYILLATKVYGKSMKDLSQDLKILSYQAIRQRKARAQKAIQSYFKKVKNSLSQFGA